MFRAESVFSEEKEAWEIEFCGTIDDDRWIREKFNGFIRFVMEADDAAFTERLAEYADVDSLTDYYLFMMTLGLTDSAAKDLVFLTYDGGPWIATVYDMEDAFGLSADGSEAASPDLFLPEKQGGFWASGTDSLLWDRLTQCFPGRIAERYRQLRAGPLSEENILQTAQGLINVIPEEWIRMDLELYPNRTPLQDPAGQILAYVPARLEVLDRVMDGMAQ